MSRNVCGTCWCTYDEQDGSCACFPISSKPLLPETKMVSLPRPTRTNELVEEILNNLSTVKAFSSAYTDMTKQVDKAWRSAISNLLEIRRINDVETQ